MKKRIKQLLKKFFGNFNFTLRTKVVGKRFKIPILGILGIQNLFVDEKWMIDLLQVIVKVDHGKFMDVGANIGQTLLKLKAVNENAEYIGFEPNPSCVHYLNKLVSINKFKEVIIVPAGISTKTEIGVLNFYHDNDSDSSASMIEGFRTNEVLRKEYISLFNVSDLHNKIDINNISILKVDVEGAELEVIESFKEHIKNDSPFIFLEILPVYNEKDNPDRFERQNKIQILLKYLGYAIFRIAKKEDKLSSINEVYDFGVHSNLNDCDYICVHENKLEKFNTELSNQLGNS